MVSYYNEFQHGLSVLLYVAIFLVILQYLLFAVFQCSDYLPPNLVGEFYIYLRISFQPEYDYSFCNYCFKDHLKI